MYFGMFRRGMWISHCVRKAGIFLSDLYRFRTVCVASGSDHSLLLLSISFQVH